MRQLQHHGAQWRVWEVDASSIPGARGRRCLIFDSDGIVRRVWAFPDSWAGLADDDVWSLLDGHLPSPVDPPTTERRSAARGDYRSVVESTAVVARAQLIQLAGSETTADRDGSRADDEMSNAMCSAIRAYASTLKREGASPEHALVLVKSAIEEGLGGPSGRDEPGADELMAGAVVWCIEAYYAA
jgi:hypothetical protein